MITSFDDCFARLMDSERGYSFRSNAADPGGETMYGVTMAVARKWGYMGAMQDMPLATAKDIARAFYWTPCHCDQLPPAIAFHVFDAVYHGGNPAQWLQRAVGVTPDGIIGPKTIEAVRSAEPSFVVLAFNRQRLDYLAKLKNWPDNARGWVNRIVRNMEVC
jgi:lysozyme family protein